MVDLKTKKVFVFRVKVLSFPALEAYKFKRKIAFYYSKPKHFRGCAKRFNCVIMFAYECCDNSHPKNRNSLSQKLKSVKPVFKSLSTKVICLPY